METSQYAVAVMVINFFGFEANIDYLLSEDPKNEGRGEEFLQDVSYENINNLMTEFWNLDNRGEFTVRVLNGKIYQTYSNDEIQDDHDLCDLITSALKENPTVKIIGNNFSISFYGNRTGAVMRFHAWNPINVDSIFEKHKHILKGGSKVDNSSHSGFDFDKEGS